MTKKASVGVVFLGGGTRWKSDAWFLRTGGERKCFTLIGAYEERQDTSYIFTPSDIDRAEASGFVRLDALNKAGGRWG